MRRLSAAVLVLAALAVAPSAGASSICKECIQRPVRAEYPAMRRCYDALLRREPAAAGRVAVRFSIQPDGRTSDVAVTHNELKDARFAACIEAVFRTLRYSETPPDTVRISYPLRFER